MIYIGYAILFIAGLLIDLIVSTLLFLITFKIDSRDIHWINYNYFEITNGWFETISSESDKSL